MTTRPAFIEGTADVAESAIIGDGSKIWHYAQVRENARLGADTIVGRGAYIGTGVVMGDGCKVQNYALVYEPARLGAGVFIGPAVVLTNDHFPRAINPDGTPKYWYQNSGGFEELMDQAGRQSKAARDLGYPVAWHVADPRVAEFLREAFEGEGWNNITVHYTQAQ